MRWWLSAAFALIAAVTALAVGKVLSDRSETAFRDRAQELAAGNAFQAAIAVRRSAGEIAGRNPTSDEFRREVSRIADRRRLALFVFDAQGNLVSSSRSRGVSLESVPDNEEALRAALAGNRYVQTDDAVGATVVAVPLGGPSSTTLIAYAAHPDLGAGIEILHTEVVRAALWAILIGALAGVVVASLIAMRLRRIGAAAAAIEQGMFETSLQPRFRDELGELAASLNRMRLRLRESFERLEYDRERLESLLERLHEGVITVDSSLRVGYANGSARRLLGRPDLRAGRRLPDPWGAKRSLRVLASGLFGPGAAAFEENVASSEDATYLVAGIPALRESDPAVIVITDISERERRERAEREFVANAAHELRTPLTTITGAVESLQSGAKDDPEARERFLGHIERESARLARLVRALLVLARAQTGEEQPLLRPVLLEPLLERIRDELRPFEGVRVEVSCRPGVAALAEPDLIAQALTNLAENAARQTARGHIRLAAARTGGRVAIEVSDTGPGIRLADRERIFDRFYRGQSRSEDGFGLGLAIVREVVRALGGKVTVDSGAGGAGTTVRVELAAAEAEAA